MVDSCARLPTRRILFAWAYQDQVLSILGFLATVPLSKAPNSPNICSPGAIQGHGCGHIVDYDGELRIRDRDRNGRFCIMLADHYNNGGSCILLASDGGGGPRSRWHLMSDPDQWIMIVDYGGIRSRWWIMIVVAADHRL
ncbi:unnamed protein product [Pleuronectes platessa]|uniref:Uncharacterized protein n=1 Tax=Pleuronectes platessa TaxID=8262 RepID=A0A9N7YM71_PLEPL|nr:unnamed protein product [Pleuronectes platessa]